MKTKNILLTLAALSVALLANAVVYSTELERRALAGDADAMYDLGACYELAAGVKQDYNKAFYWYYKSYEQGNQWGQSALGSCYYNGWGVEADREKALYCWKLASDQGNWGATYNIAMLYFEHEQYPEAIEWFNRSQTTGAALPAKYELGMCYYSKWSGQDFKKAFDYFSQAVNEDNCPRSRAKLAEMYYYGYYVDNDYNKAFQFSHESVGQSEFLEPSGDAMRILSICYRFGHGTTQNIEQADYWNNKAKEAGDDRTMMMEKTLKKK